MTAGPSPAVIAVVLLQDAVYIFSFKPFSTLLSRKIVHLNYTSHLYQVMAWFKKLIAFVEFLFIKILYLLHYI